MIYGTFAFRNSKMSMRVLVIQGQKFGLDALFAPSLLRRTPGATSVAGRALLYITPPTLTFVFSAAFTAGDPLGWGLRGPELRPSVVLVWTLYSLTWIWTLLHKAHPLSAPSPAEAGCTPLPHLHGLVHPLPHLHGLVHPLPHLHGLVHPSPPPRLGAPLSPHRSRVHPRLQTPPLHR